MWFAKPYKASSKSNSVVMVKQKENDKKIVTGWSGKNRPMFCWYYTAHQFLLVVTVHYKSGDLLVACSRCFHYVIGERKCKGLRLHEVLDIPFIYEIFRIIV
jgi:hypothetical protein